MRSAVVLGLVVFVACEGRSDAPDAGASSSSSGGASSSASASSSSTASSDIVVSSSSVASSSLGSSSSEAPASSLCTGTAGLEVYERRIEPLVTGGQPNSCQQCHLSGVNLGMFVQDTPCQSMACLVERGWVDLEHPSQSSVLSMILNASPQSELITQAVIDAEYQGFLEWITWSAQCGGAVCGAIEDPCNSGSGNASLDNVSTPLGGCSEDAIGTDFRQRVWTYKERCAGCHSAVNTEGNEVAPRFIDVGADRPAALRTMYNILGRGLVDVENPGASLLLTKPLAGIVDHGGGDKFENTLDVTYQSFAAWIGNYSECFLSTGNGPRPDAGPQAPIAHIAFPNPGDAPRTAGNLIPFIGDARDPQQGRLVDGALVWTSNLVGAPIGSGEMFNTTLPAGEHTITLTATDNDGFTGTASITVIVVE